MLSLLNTTFTNAVRKGFTLVGSLLSKLKARSTYFENKNCTKATLEDLDDVNLLEKASIITTPTAYSDGKLHSVKPVQHLGDELVVNGDFDTDSNWVKGTGWTISGGKANVNATSNTDLYQNIGTVAGKTYKISFEVSNYVLGSVKVILGYGSSPELPLLVATSNGVYEVETTPNAINPQNIYISTKTANTQLSIDNISIKEVIDADFDFQRGSAATRVNSQGLIENVQIISPELVSNGNFSEIGTEEVLNGNFSQEGSELVTNGDFATDSDWTKGTGWSISSGFANCDGTQTSSSILRQNSVFTSGKTYQIQLDVTSYTSGSLQVSLHSVWSSSITSVGTYTFFINATIDWLKIQADASFVGSIDNVSVKEVGQNWTLGSGWSIGDSVAYSDNTQTNYESIQQSSVTTIGKTYELKFNLNLDSGVIQAKGNAVYETYYPADNGEVVSYFVADSTSFRFTSFPNNTLGSITNISVKEVGQDWTLGTGASMGDGVVIVDGTGGNYDNIIYQDTNVSFANKKVKIKFDVLNYVSGKMRVSAGNSAVTPHVEANGSYEFISNVSAGNDILYFLNYQVPFVGSIDNVSVIQITDDTDLPRIDYTDGCGSLLLEPQSTNLIDYSSDFSQSSWVKQGVTITIDDAISPDGTQNADLLKGNTSLSRHYILDGLVATNVSATISFFAKAKELRYIQIACQNTGNQYANFDIQDGVVGVVGSDFSDAKIEDYGNGWYRCSAVSTNRYTTVWVSLISGLNGGWLENWAMSNNTDGLYIWGFQLEQLSYPTSYIPTNGSTATRLADVCDNAGSSDLINSTEGVLYAEISANNLSTFKNISISNGTNSNRINLFIYISSVTVSFDVGGNNQSYLSYSLPNVSDFNKIAFSYKLNEFKLFVNGVQRAIDTLGTVPSINTFDVLSFNDSFGNNFYGNVKSVAVFKEALTNDELEGLTGEGYDTFNALALANNYTII